MHHCCQSCNRSSGNSMSHVKPRSHIFWKRHFTLIVKGDRNPIGSKMRAAACNTPLFVFVEVFRNSIKLVKSKTSHLVPFSMLVQELTHYFSLRLFHLLCFPFLHPTGLSALQSLCSICTNSFLLLLRCF